MLIPLGLIMADKTCDSCEHECVILNYNCPIFGGMREVDAYYCINCEVVVE